MPTSASNLVTRDASNANVVVLPDVSARSADRHLPAAATTTILDVVVPVYNEERGLATSVHRLHRHLTATFPYRFRITVADNASTDDTLVVAHGLAEELAEVAVLHLAEKGRGRALRTAWTQSDAPVLAYMDVDLSTDLNALLPLVAPLISGHSDVAIGTRLARTSRVVRGAKREVISRCYNQVLRRTMAVRFSDAQCGFKAVRADVAGRLLPLVKDSGWFFDTELLLLAERSGMRIHEVPVDWVDDPDSRVDIVHTATEDLKGVVRVARSLATGQLPLAAVRAELGRGPLVVAVPGVPRGMVGQLARFGAVGVASTLAYLLLFTLMRPAGGAQAANLAALLLTGVANTAANRRITFGVTGRVGVGRQQAQGLLVFALGLGLTSGSLFVLNALSSHPGRVLEISVLVLANAAATAVRFVLLRAWVFRTRRPA